MKQSWWVRFSILLVAIVVSITLIVPTFVDFSEDSSYPVDSKISLGLDLQGGLYMILGIDFNKAYLDEIKSYAVRMVFQLKEEGISAEVGPVNTKDRSDPRITIKIVNKSDMVKAHDVIKKYFSSNVRLTYKGSNSFEYGVTSRIRNQVEKQSVSKSIEVIRNRIDEFGVSEPEIISQGNDRIVVQLPGVKDVARAKSLIGKTAKLEFKIVNREIDPATVSGWLEKAVKAGIEFKKGTLFSNYIHQLNEFLKKDIPAGHLIAFEKKKDPASGEQQLIPYIVEETAHITGDDLQDARVGVNQQENSPYVSLEFKSSGAKRFEDLTGKNVGKLLAIILDGNVYSAPVLKDKISGGRAQISLGQGDYNTIMKEASAIALVLRAGALPVQLDFLEQRTVGPSLGEDSIGKAEVASLLGCLLVFVFILLYYKTAGFIATITLVVNILFILAGLVLLGATLTLPGIAGIALTVGMAVDGNIIIYERIREEVRKGATNYKAVESGFDSAFWTIIDANITTALAGICLLNFGTGPIRGFAVTLLIGIAATVYTSYFVGRLLFEFYMDKVEGQELSI